MGNLLYGQVGVLPGLETTKAHFIHIFIVYVHRTRPAMPYAPSTMATRTGSLVPMLDTSSSGT